MGIWQLMTWMMTGSSQKSEAEVIHLVHEVLQAKDFDPVHFDGFNAHAQMSHFDRSESATSVGLQQDGWKESSMPSSLKQLQSGSISHHLNKSGNLPLQVKNSASMMNYILQMHGSPHTMI